MNERTIDEYNKKKHVKASHRQFVSSLAITILNYYFYYYY